MSKISKLGLGIIAFEGTEHIVNITYEIRDYCDTIIVCLQKESYHGDPIDEADVKDVENLKTLGYIDEIIWFEPTNLYKEEPITGPRMVETDKRNFILDYLENTCKCSHTMVIDSDEFYDRVDFKRAKDVIDSSNEIHVTYCQYINYYRDYQHVLVWPYLAYVPFITEAKYRFSFKNGSFDKPSDITRRYLIDGEDKEYHILSYQTVKMHHLSWIRKDIEKKIAGWSAKNYFKDIPNLKDAMLYRYNNYIEGQNAIIMFKTPMYQVIVNKLPKQYIHPRFALYQKPTQYLGYESSNNNS